MIRWLGLAGLPGKTTIRQANRSSQLGMRSYCALGPQPEKEIVAGQAMISPLLRQSFLFSSMTVFLCLRFFVYQTCHFLCLCHTSTVIPRLSLCKFATTRAPLPYPSYSPCQGSCFRSKRHQLGRQTPATSSPSSKSGPQAFGDCMLQLRGRRIHVCACAHEHACSCVCVCVCVCLCVSVSVSVCMFMCVGVCVSHRRQGGGLSNAPAHVL